MSQQRTAVEAPAEGSVYVLTCIDLTASHAFITVGTAPLLIALTYACRSVQSIPPAKRIGQVSNGSDRCRMPSERRQRKAGERQ